MNLKSKKLLHFTIGILLLIIISLVPLPLATHQSYVLALALSSFYLWVTEAIPLYVTSLYILFIEVVIITPILIEKDLIKDSSPFMAPFSSNIIFLFLGGLLLAKAVSKYGLDRLLANKVVILSKGHPQLTLLSIMVTTAFLSMWMSNTATTAMMLIVATALIADFDKSTTFDKAFILGIPFSANLGGMGTPIGTPSNAIAIKEINAAMPDSISFFGWMIAVIPFVIILILLLWYILITLYKAPKQKLKTIEAPLATLSSSHYTVLIIFLLTAIMWLTTSFHHIPSGMVALIPAIVFLSSGILNQQDFRSISFDVLYLVAGGIALSVALNVSGLSLTILESFPIQNIGQITLCLIFLVIGAIMTTFISNTATANIIIPMIFIIPNIAHLPIAITTTLAISSSMILPVSTPPNAIAYSSGNIALKDMVKVGFLITTLSAILFFTFGKTYWKFINII